MWQNLKHNLFLQVVFALIIGIALGLSFHDFSLNLKPLGDGFISLIKMLIAPIVFCVVVLGIYGAQDIKKMGKVGAKTILYFEMALLHKGLKDKAPLEDPNLSYNSGLRSA